MSTNNFGKFQPRFSAMASQTVSVLSRFKGCMVGALVGDCIGAFYEAMPTAPVPKIVEFIEKNIEKNRASPAPFTDDTAMARSVAASLIECRWLDTHDMARRFVEEFQVEPYRGYGASVGTVFDALQAESYSDVHGPASRQFNGSGSYGNGGGMRIAPAALYGYNMDGDELDNMVKDITKITHSHEDGIFGAILQASAVHSALQLPWQPDQPLAVCDWLDQLKMRISEHEHCASCSDRAPSGGEGDSTGSPPSRRQKRHSSEKPTTYCCKLEKLKEYLTSTVDPPLQEFETMIGTGIAAKEACPAAVYSFARCTRTVDNIPKENPFERTIIHSISLGGDTDTIATMAGAIAGAYYGIESIPQSWQDSCEGLSTALSSSEKLLKMLEVTEKQSSTDNVEKLQAWMHSE